MQAIHVHQLANPEVASTIFLTILFRAKREGRSMAARSDALRCFSGVPTKWSSANAEGLPSERHCAIRIAVRGWLL